MPWYYYFAPAVVAAYFLFYAFIRKDLETDEYLQFLSPIAWKDCDTVVEEVRKRYGRPPIRKVACMHLFVLVDRGQATSRIASSHFISDTKVINVYEFKKINGGRRKRKMKKTKKKEVLFGLPA